MERFTRCWLVTNSASGSNRADAVSNLRRSLETRGIAIEKSIEFPDQELPTPAELAAANHPLLVVFTGDGSANAAISALEGWGGAVLFIPGGTKNLLGQRLHRDCEPEVIVEQVAKGAARRVRPNVCRSDHGLGLAEILVGPGTCWSGRRSA
jgi:diacylglycerol kinase family enzyme